MRFDQLFAMATACLAYAVWAEYEIKAHDRWLTERQRYQAMRDMHFARGVYTLALWLSVDEPQDDAWLMNKYVVAEAKTINELSV